MDISLNNLDWSLRGWNKNQWNYLRTMETGSVVIPPVAPIKATVPGGVHADLMKAGYIADFNYGQKTLDMEWVENREWTYEASFRTPEGYDKLILCFDGLDYSGCVLLNNERILDFEGTHLTWRVDVTGYLRPGEDNALKVVFFRPPEVTGQTGWTTREKTLKPRFNYVWDWCPRIVNIGIWQDVRLHGYNRAEIREFYPKATLAGAQGKLEVRLDINADAPGVYDAEVTVLHEGHEVARQTFSKPLRCSDREVLEGEMTIPDAAVWWPVGMGEQPLYEVQVRLLHNGTTCDAAAKTVGFRTMDYRRNPGAPADSLPYTIVVNGRPLFIQGINWVPLSPLYGTVTAEEYRRTLQTFRDMHINMLRIWGGAILETETFYRLCDEMGFLVWQEFPQSSSGIDNTPCEEAEYIAALCKVAETDIRLRRHHASLAVWCGGNELMWCNYVPVDNRSMNIRALEDLVHRLHPESLFLPTSASGYTFNFNEALLGQGKNHDVHGPWDYLGPEEHYRLFNIDDSLIHTETGCPAPPRLDTLVKFSEGAALWPPNETNRFWIHRGSWWIRQEQMEGLYGDFHEDIAAYVKAFRHMQAESLGYSAEAVRRRAPQKSGIIIWMGGEPFPNSCNTSLIEYDGAAKPAYYRLMEAFAPIHPSAAYDRLSYKTGDTFRARLHLAAQEGTRPAQLQYRVMDIRGNVLEEKTLPVSRSGMVSEITFTVGECDANVFFLLLNATDESGRTYTAQYIFPVAAAGEKPLQPLLHLQQAALTLRTTDDGCTLENTGTAAAVGVFVLGETEEGRVVNLAPNYLTVFPGEKKMLRFLNPPEERVAVITAEGLNIPDIRARREARNIDVLAVNGPLVRGHHR